jgi:hypothetical protein
VWEHFWKAHGKIQLRRVCGQLSNGRMFVDSAAKGVDVRTAQRCGSVGLAADSLN